MRQTMTDLGFDYTETKYGFVWGEAEVHRVASDPKWGVIISIKGHGCEIAIRVTPKGAKMLVETAGNVSVHP